MRTLNRSFIALACWSGCLAGTKADEPNLLLDVSGRLIAKVVEQSIDRTEPVRETIQDTPVEGIGRTIAIVAAELVPSSRSAAVDVVLRGANWSRSVGIRNNVYVHTFTTTPLEVGRRIVFDDKGIHLFERPSVAHSTTELLDIESRTWPAGPTIRFARRVFEQSQHDAEAETAQKTAEQASARLGGELAPTLDTLAKSVGRELSAFKKDRLPLESMKFQTTNSVMQARLRFGVGDRPQTRRAPDMPSSTDLGVRIHESLANEAAEKELSGRAFLVNSVSNVYDEVTRGVICDGRRPGEREGLEKVQKAFAEFAGKPVTITLAKKDPLTVVFADQGFTIDIRFASIKQEDRFYEGLQLRAVYKLSNEKDGVHALRQGPVQILPLKTPPEPGKKIEPLPLQFRLLQELLFAEVLTSRLTLAPPAMPAALGSVRLAPPRAFALDGWLGLAWKMNK